MSKDSIKRWRCIKINPTWKRNCLPPANVVMSRERERCAQCMMCTLHVAEIVSRFLWYEAKRQPLLSQLTTCTTMTIKIANETNDFINIHVPWSFGRLNWQLMVTQRDREWEKMFLCRRSAATHDATKTSGIVSNQIQMTMAILSFRFQFNIVVHAATSIESNTSCIIYRTTKSMLTPMILV